MSTPEVKDDNYWYSPRGIHDPDNPYAEPLNKPGTDGYDREMAEYYFAELAASRRASEARQASQAAAVKEAMQRIATEKKQAAVKEATERAASDVEEANSDPYSLSNDPRRKAKIAANKRLQAGTTDEDWVKTLVPMKGGVVFDPKTKTYYRISPSMAGVKSTDLLTEKQTAEILAKIAASAGENRLSNLTEPYGGKAAILVPTQKSEASTQVHAAEVEQQQRQPEDPPTLPRYIKNIQALMINDIDTISEHFKKLDRSKSKKYKPKHIFSLTDELPGGTFMSRMSGYAHPSGLMGAFIHATPAQLGLLVPTMRFFMVDSEGSQEEIYFSEYGSAKHIKNMADIRRRGSIYELLGPKNQQGAEAGIKSFQWRFHTAHEGDYTLESSMEIYFGSLAELTNINYLQFLFPSGIDNPDALAINDPENKKYRPSSPAGIDLQKKERLISQINNLEDLLKKSESKIRDGFAQRQFTTSVKRNYRQLKVVVGWSLPKGNTGKMKKLFSTEDQYTAFMNGVAASNRAILLNYTGHDINFTQEGPTTLSISFIGSVRNYLVNESSDIFGSSNLESATKMWSPVAVSVDGFKMRKGNVVDPKTAASGQKDPTYSVGQNINALSVNSEFSPYLRSKDRSPAIDEQGETTIMVTLGGLRLSGELVKKRMQLLELLNTPTESDKYSELRKTGQMISLLYHRAHINQKRDLYSSFMDAMIDAGDRVFKARVILADDGKSKVDIIYDPDKIAARDRRREMQNEADAAKQARLEKQKAEEAAAGMSIYGPEDPPLPPKQNEVDVYYMRLGDVLLTAMEQAGMRDDISFILGNHETKTGYRYSIYDVPVTLGSFGQFFYDKVVKPGLLQLPYNTFQKYLLRYMSSAFNRDPQSTEDIEFETSLVTTTTKPNTNSFKKLTSRNLSNGILREIGSGELNPTAKFGKKLHHYYTIYARSYDLDRFKGKRVDDEKDGVYHYVVGSDRGLAKRFDFSKQDIPFFTEMNIETGTSIGVAKSVFLPQDVTIQMYGNGIHKVGDFLFVDSAPALGAYAGPILGIGGYYSVKFATHTISAGGTYETSLECVFQKKDPRGGTST